VVGKPEEGCARQEKKSGRGSSTKAEELTPKILRGESIEADKYHRIRTGEVRDQDALQSDTRGAWPVNQWCYM
jgi:hypothetical protein